MAIKLTHQEALLSSKIRRLKEESGSHSPSIFTLNDQLPDLNIKIDACFLSNPYATDLFLKYLKRELIQCESKFRDILEFYPSQNEVISKALAHKLQVASDNIFIGNGAVEVIQAVLHNFVKRRVLVTIPTFSPYYEYIKDNNQIIYYKLKKEHNFQINPQDYIETVKKNKVDTIVLINPNNPDGGYLEYKNLRRILLELKELENIIIDESFTHFAFEDEEYTLISAVDLFKEFENTIVVKSMSKDFGIAGIRCGYGVMSKYKVMTLLRNGYLWNSNGLAEYFFRLYQQKEFSREYEIVRQQYIKEAQYFFQELSKIKTLKVYQSKANFALLELLDGTTSVNFVSKLLIKYGIYSRNCSDKIGLDGEFVRIAARTKDQNETILSSIKALYESQ